MALVQIRFNTEHMRDPSVLPWRVLVDGVERLASSVMILTSAWTTSQLLSGERKWHLTCVGEPVWDGEYCTVRENGISHACS